MSAALTPTTGRASSSQILNVETFDMVVKQAAAEALEGQSPRHPQAC
jgi:hypothetical protein